MDYHIEFEKLDWVTIQNGMDQKVYSKNNKILRLVKIGNAFVETDWCLNNHIGYVIRGKMKIDFDGAIHQYKKGDGLWIEDGKNSKHKVIIEKGEEVELILFEIKK
jgi:hypothetical protein